MIDMEEAKQLVDPDAVIWDGCDEAIIGTGYRCGQKTLFVYDYQTLVNVFVNKGMSHEEATEWVDYNIVGAWAGEGTPIVLFATTTDTSATTTDTD